MRRHTTTVFFDITVCIFCFLSFSFKRRALILLLTLMSSLIQRRQLLVRPSSLEVIYGSRLSCYRSRVTESFVTTMSSEVIKTTGTHRRPRWCGESISLVTEAFVKAVRITHTLMHGHTHTRRQWAYDIWVLERSLVRKQWFWIACIRCFILPVTHAEGQHSRSEGDPCHLGMKYVLSISMSSKGRKEE